MKNLFRLLVGLLAATAVARAATDSNRPQLVQHVETCEAILREFMADPATAIPAEVLAHARALVIVNQFKAGFIIGVQGGYGAILVKKADGHWSVPALIKAGEASLGLQIGGKAVEIIYVITDDQTPRLLFKGKVNVGVDAKAVAGPRAAETEKWNRETILATPVLVYTKSRGLYAGATVKAGFLSRDDESNQALYHTSYNLPELLYSDWVAPVDEVKPFIDYVKKIAP